MKSSSLEPKESKPNSLVGHSSLRQDGPEKVTGAARYTADLKLPGTLYARLVVSPYAHALIESLDGSAALQIPGVVRVLTAQDLPIRLDEKGESRKRNPLAAREVLFYGQPVAVVLADTPAAAQDGVSAVTVVYQPLPALTHISKATHSTTPPVHKKAATETSGENKPLPPFGINPQHPNVTNRVEFVQGDVEQGFKEADVIIENTYHLPMVHQGYLEPHVCLAVPEPLGGLTVYTSTQSLFSTRREVAMAVGLPLSKIKIVIPAVGGGFGGKGGVLLEPLCAALALLTGRGVSLAFSQIEDLAAANPAPNGSIWLKTGAKQDGTLIALQACLLFNTGAYPEGSPVWLAGLKLSVYYPVANFNIVGYEVLTHQVGGGAYRAPGGPQSTFAIESHMDALARALRLDPLALRRKNSNPADESMRQVLARLENSQLWTKRGSKVQHEGWGLATGSWATCMGAASAGCRLDDDGNFTLVTGVADISGVSTSLAQIAGEVLGIKNLAQIRVISADSDSAPHAGPSGGSQMTYNLGGAVNKAAQEARNQILHIAAELYLEASPADLDLIDGTVTVKGAPSRKISLKEIASASTNEYEGKCAPVYGQGSYVSQEWPIGCFAHLAHVRVDVETGEVTVLDYLVVQDVGYAINPALVEGQIHGGVVQGLGWALYEELVYDKQTGTLLSNTLMDYAMQNASLVPNIETELVYVASAQGPYGAKGVGEAPIVPGAAAIASAIYDAVGVRITELPATPQRVLKALEGAKL